jgi:hypothetical protein
VIAGTLIYLNELVPTKTDFRLLQRALKNNTKDVILPETGSADERVLRNWKAKDKEDEPPLLSFPFRLRRAIRVIPITDASIAKSLKEFDDTVGRIEKCLAEEARTGCVISSWEKNSEHEPTCEACDSRTYCPEFKGMTAPRLPGQPI